jgi:hypothetical protein
MRTAIPTTTRRPSDDRPDTARGALPIFAGALTRRKAMNSSVLRTRSTG